MSDSPYETIAVSASLHFDDLEVKRSYLESQGIQCAIIHDNAGPWVGYGAIYARLIVRADQVEESRLLLAGVE